MLKQNLNINEIRTFLSLVNKFDISIVDDKLMRMFIIQELGKVAIRLETKLIDLQLKPQNTKKVFKFKWSFAQMLAIREFVGSTLFTFPETSYEYNLLMIVSNNIDQISA